MHLQTLLNDLQEKQIYGSPKEANIEEIVCDPLRVKLGFLCVAINVFTQLNKIELPDDHPLVMDAIRNGAVAVLLQKDFPVPEHVVKVLVPDSRLALGLLASRFYAFPLRRFKLVGVTGTNGKTTTTHIIESIFIQQFKIGLIGTLYYKLNGEIRKSKDTTPEPTDLQEILVQMAEGLIKYPLPVLPQEILPSS
jgi:UDP-N-acetylmuramoyl-L-alanyl-D-glutamate--2,6-diaminopimelate ligase